mmetsp:Transcript_10090/g.9786  ORF Transcript_10090/g.9786 Transcript_10090/m.9786 type:complete len:373 (+) Transcript_10090:150-1268(+)
MKVLYYTVYLASALIYLIDKAFSININKYASEDVLPFGGEILGEALRYFLGHKNILLDSPDLFPPKKDKTSSALQPSRIWRTCIDYLACEYPIPSLEISNAIFYNGILYLNNIDEKSKNVLLDIQRFHGTKKGYLPSTLVQHGSIIEWLHGPQIALYNENDPNSFPSGTKLKCFKVWNTSAYFLHQWEVTNTYHTLNDNILSILASIIVQYVSSTESMEEYRTLFVFNRMGGSNRYAKPSKILDILFWLFQGDVRPAKSVLEGGPHCVRHISWGTSMKPLYRDSLFELRRVIYLILNRTLQKSPQYPMDPAAELRDDRIVHNTRMNSLTNTTFPSVSTFSSKNNIDAHTIQHPYPRVVIVTRNVPESQKRRW